MTSFSCKYVDGNAVLMSSRCMNTGPCQGGVLNDLDLIERFYHKVRTKSRAAYFFLDVGTNTGSFCLLPAIDERFSCFALEPNSETRGILKDNIALNNLGSRVTVFPVGAWETNTTLTLKIPDEPKYSGVSTVAVDPNRFKMSGIESYHTEEVSCRSLDSLLSDYGDPWVDAVKIDAEGAELSTLYGARHVLERCQPLVLLEYDNKNTHQFGYSREDLRGHLESMGYTDFEQHNDSDLFAWS